MAKKTLTTADSCSKIMSQAKTSRRSTRPEDQTPQGKGRSASEVQSPPQGPQGRSFGDAHPQENRREEQDFRGWISKNDKWVKMFDVLTDTKKDEVSYGEYDNLIRQLVSPSCEDAGMVSTGQ